MSLFYNVISHMKRNFRECSDALGMIQKNKKKIVIKAYKIIIEPQMAFILIQEQQNNQ